MKPKYCTLFIAILLFNIAAAQNQANIWYFGDFCGVDFNTGVPINTHEILAASSNSMSVMCDTSGDFLFCFSTKFVWNRDGNYMPNGMNFIGDSRASMGALIVQQPGSDHLYYLFTVDYDDWGSPDIGMHYSVVDMNLDGGLGDVTTEKNIPLAQAWSASNKLTSARHANGEDVWILTRNFKMDQWYAAFLLTSSGLSTQAVLSPVPERLDSHNEGSMKISPDKKYLAAAYENCDCQDFIKTSLDICSFNASSGEIDLLYTLTKNTFHIGSYEPYAVEFSPDSKLLYVSYFNAVVLEMELYQYDMQYVEDSLQFKQSEIFIARGPVQGLQLARDGKIYCTMPWAGGHIYDYLSVIHEPWKRGVACNYQADAVYLDDRQTHAYLPNMLLDHLYRFEWEGQCAGQPIAFQPNFIPEPSSILWSFGDGEISTALWPVHEYEDGGEYEVFVTVNYPSGRVEKTSRVITVFDAPNPDLGPDQLICEGEETVLTAGNDTGFYAWSTGSIGNNVFSITVSDTGTYWVKVINDLGCSLSDTIHVGWYEKAIFNEDNMVITPTACGGSNGSIVGLQVEAYQLFLLKWYDGNGNLISSDIDIFNLAVGNYFLHAIDGHGCTTISEAYTITDAGDIDILEVHFNAVHCGQENGSIEIAASSGAGTDLLYSIDNGSNWQTESTFTDLAAGTYFVKVGDQGDCETVFENNPIAIENIPGPEVTTVSTAPENDYLADGSINIEALVESGDILYSIDNGSTFQTNDGLFENLSAGTYTCMVKDDFGCDTSFNLTIERILSQVIDAIAGDGYTCIGEATASELLLNNFTEIDSFHVQLTYDPNVTQCDGYIQVHPELENGLSASVIPALGEVHITWKGEEPTTLTENAKMLELIFSGINEGVSQVDWKAEPGEGQFFNANGEEIAVNYELGAIRIFTRPEIIMGTEIQACEGDTIFLPPFVLGGTGEYDFYWTGPADFTSTNKELNIKGIQQNQDGMYQLTVTDTIDCVESRSMNISVNPLPEIAFSTYDTIWAEPGYLLEAGNGAEYYLWNTGEITEAIQIDSMGQYVVEVISYAGCKSKDAVQVLWGESGEPFYMPNAFTPNGDGLNDTFRAVPKYDYISSYQLVIYNRWGQQIFECNDIDCGWDGTYIGNPSPNGAYIYRVVYEEISQPSKTKTIDGTVMLVR